MKRLVPFDGWDLILIVPSSRLTRSSMLDKPNRLSLKDLARRRSTSKPWPLSSIRKIIFGDDATSRTAAWLAWACFLILLRPSWIRRYKLISVSKSSFK